VQCAAWLAVSLAGGPVAAQEGGLGLVIRMQGGWVTVMRVLPGTPAEQGGVRAGDRIVRVDSHSTRGQGLMQVVAWIRGAPGSAITLHVQRLKPDGGYSGATRRLRLQRYLLPIRQ
jgi:C-terminal processing protease CtpA/Prc